MITEVKDLVLQYGDRIIQSSINFDVKEGEIFAIMGGSGCGKSTLLKSMIGLIPVSEGSVRYDGKEFLSAGTVERRTLLSQFGVLYQQSALWSSMTIGENVALPLRFHRKELNEEEVQRIVSYKLALVGLGGYEDYAPFEISGGMRKRAALARAMALDPQILFFDEPQAGLDPITSSRLDELILEIRNSLGTTVILVTHELDSLFAIVDRAIFLDASIRKPTAIGNPRAMKENPPNEAVGAFLRREG